MNASHQQHLQHFLALSARHFGLDRPACCEAGAPPGGEPEAAEWPAAPYPSDRGHADEECIRQC